MKIKRRYVPVLVVAGITVGIGLALVLALFAGVGLVRAAEGPAPGCGTAPNGESYCCEGSGYDLTCWGPAVESYFGCDRIGTYLYCPEFNGDAIGTPTQISDSITVTLCYMAYFCFEDTGGAIWLADVCEPDDGFSANGEMTLDSDFPGPLRFAGSIDGPWYEVAVNGPPWVVTEEMLEAFAAMAGVDDWHDLWVRSGDGYPQYLGNMIVERDVRMDELCGG